MIVAVCQMNIIPANPMTNAKTIMNMTDVAIQRSNHRLRLVLFPELAIPGYLIGDMWEETSFLRECKAAERRVREYASEKGVYIAFGNVCTTDTTQHDGRVTKYNALIVAAPSGVDQCYGGYIPDSFGDSFIPKTLLPNYREFDEPRHFTANQNPDLIQPLKIIDDDGRVVKVGFALCEDGWDADYEIKVMQILAQKNADLLVNHSCSPFTSGKNGKRNRVFGEHARRAGVPLIYVNSVGLQNNGKTVFSFDGCSVVYDNNGKPMFESPMFESDIFLYDTDTNAIATAWRPKTKVKHPSEIGDIYQAAVYGIREYCAQSNIRRVVIGSSGGVDSAVSAALHVEALGAENVFLVNMPSQYNSETTINFSKQLAINLGCKYAIVPISDSVDHTVAQIDGLNFTAISNDVAEQIVNDCDTVTVKLSGLNIENIQARDRSSRILAAIASGLGAVFSNNGNKAETTVGYATLYGDVCGYLAPLADMWKEQIYLLGKYINHINGKHLIPIGIFHIVASAELSDVQNVDAGKGDPIIYWYHDRLFKSWVQDWNRKTPEEILQWYIDGTLAVNLDFPKNQFGEYRSITEIFSSHTEFITDLERWWRLYKGMGIAKRVQAPPIIALSKRVFGFDLRESLNCCLFTSRYTQMKTELEFRLKD